MKKKYPLLAMIMLSMYLGLWGRHLAIYQNGNPDPMKVLPYCADLYPQKDLQALHKGIPFSTPEQLSKLLEDYTA